MSLFDADCVEPEKRSPGRQRYECKDCGKRFDDLSGTIFVRHHRPLNVWILYLYFMGLNLSNKQIAWNFGLHR
jgi:transposase-like protein